MATLLSAWVLNNILLLVVGYLRVRNPMVMGVMPASGLASVAVMAVFALLYFRQEKVNTFSIEVMQELHKVTWPGRKETSMSTVVVVICVILIAAILGLYDWACGKFISLFLRV